MSFLLEKIIRIKRLKLPKLFSIKRKQSALVKSKKEFTDTQLTKSSDYTLDELMAGIRDENKHARIDFGPAQGKEFL